MYFRILKGPPPRPDGEAHPPTTESRADTYGASFDEATTAPALEDKEYVPTDHDQPSAIKSIEEDYGESIAGHIIVRDEVLDRRGHINCFWVFDGPEKVFETIGRAPRTFHEVCLPGVPRKLAWDFDFSAEHFKSLATSSHEGDNRLFHAMMQPAETLLGEGAGADPDPLISALPSAALADLKATLDKERATTGGFGQFSNAADSHLHIFGRVMLRHFLRFLVAMFPRSYVLLCESSTVASSKFSAHIIIGAFCEHYYDVAEYAMRLYERFRSHDPLAHMAANFIDMGVYKSIQNFRMLGCAKLGASPDRRKVLVNNPWGSDDPLRGFCGTLLTYVRGDTDLQLSARFDIRLIKNKTFDVETTGVGQQAQLPADFMARLGAHGVGFKVRKVVDNLVLFHRETASECHFCGRRHDADNTLFVSIIPGVAGSVSKYVIMCRRDPYHRKIIVDGAAVSTRRGRA